MAAKCVVLVFVCLINGVYMGEASEKIPDTLLSPWYCQRLVPAFITAAVTPCTYPCLLLSPHEHPRIIVQPEKDETPCRVGKCRGSVCRTTSHHAKLKRKKRFICLFTLVKWLRAKKKLDELKKIIKKLEQEAQERRNNAIPLVEGGAAGPYEISSNDSPGGAAFSVNNGGSNFGGTGSGGRLGVPDIVRGSRGSLGIESNGNLVADIPPTLMTEGFPSGISDASLRGNGNDVGGLVGRGSEGTTATGPGTPSSNGLNILAVGTRARGLGNNGVGNGVTSGISANNRNALGSSTLNNYNIATSSPLESHGVGAVVSSTYSRSAASATSGSTDSGGTSVNSIVNTDSGSSAVGVISSGNNVALGANSMGNDQPNARISGVRS